MHKLGYPQNINFQNRINTKTLMQNVNPVSYFYFFLFIK